MSNSLVQALIAHFGSVFEGPNGDYPAVLEALGGELPLAKQYGNQHRNRIPSGRS